VLLSYGKMNSALMTINLLSIPVRAETENNIMTVILMVPNIDLLGNSKGEKDIIEIDFEFFFTPLIIIVTWQLLHA
jgi:hypothetical protein